MRVVTAVLVLVLVWSAPATADDWADGLEAYDGGDYARAVALWRCAADAGHLDAMAAIADAYARGLGVAPDLAAAAAGRGARVHDRRGTRRRRRPPARLAAPRGLIAGAAL